MKVIELYFPVVLLQSGLLLNFVDESLKCDHSSTFLCIKSLTVTTEMLLTSTNAFSMQ